MTTFLLFFLGTLAAATASQASPPHLKVTIETVAGTGDDPMIVLWLESRQGFVKTLYWFSKDHEWYKDLSDWDAKRAQVYPTWKEEPGIDAVMGPTIGWGERKSCEIPLRIGNIDLLSGQYRLRIEQGKDKGGHYRNFKLPLKPDFSGGTVDTTIGYMRELKIEVIR